MSRLHLVARVTDIPPGTAAEFEVAGLLVAVFHVDGAFYAVGATCTHRDAPLAEGRVEGTRVTCPWHAAQFDLTTGACLAPPASRPVPRYAVRIQDGQVLVEIP